MQQYSCSAESKHSVCYTTRKFNFPLIYTVTVQFNIFTEMSARRTGKFPVVLHWQVLTLTLLQYQRKAFYPDNIHNPQYYSYNQMYCFILHFKVICTKNFPLKKSD